MHEYHDTASFLGIDINPATQMLLKSAIFIPIFSDRKQRSRYSNATHSG
ncbi:MAG: hypothetical protein V7K88_28740 [Nostoc sp.]